MSYMLLFLLGFFAANGVPHFVKGITGEKHMTPFGKPSSAQVNVLWGIANFYIAFWMWYWAQRFDYDIFPASLAVLCGVLAAGSICTRLWSNDSEARGHELHN
jgi:hypothetical protein